jgi:hypothetical protein
MVTQQPTTRPVAASESGPPLFLDPRRFHGRLAGEWFSRKQNGMRKAAAGVSGRAWSLVLVAPLARREGRNPQRSGALSSWPERLEYSLR